MKEVLFDKLVQAICDSVEICSNKSEIEQFAIDSSIVCHDSKLGTYTISTTSGPLAVAIVQQPRSFGFSFNVSDMEDDVITLTITTCNSNQECTTVTSNAPLEHSQVSVVIIIIVSVVAVIITIVIVIMSVLLALTLVWYKR